MSARSVPPAPAMRLRDLREARRYLAGQALSILGDNALWLAMAIWVRELTGSNAEAGLTFFFFAVPSVAGPLWGTLVDRWPRRPVLIGVNAAAAVVVLGLLAVHGRHQVWIIWLVMVAYGVSSSVLTSAQSGFLHTLVPEEGLSAAQAFLVTVRQGIRLVSPLLGAGLFTLVGGHAVAVLDATTFAVAAVSVATIRVAETPPPKAERPGFRIELKAGVTHIRQVAVLRQVVTAMTAVCAVIGFTETATIAVVTTGLHRSAVWLGPLDTVMGIGALIGGPTVSWAIRRWGEGTTCGLGAVVAGCGTALMVFPAVAPVAAGMTLFGFGVPWLAASANTLVQRLTPNGLQGRVSGAANLLFGTPQSISIAVGAGLITLAGYQTLLAVVALVTVTAGGWLLTRPEQRRVARHTPEVGDGTAGAGSVTP